MDGVCFFEALGEKKWSIGVVEYWRKRLRKWV